jgi:hypothetical protein
MQANHIVGLDRGHGVSALLTSELAFLIQTGTEGTAGSTTPSMRSAYSLLWSLGMVN